MSNRSVKWLEKQKKPSQGKPKIEDDEDDNSPDVGFATSSVSGNIYDYFNDDDDDDETNDLSDDDELKANSTTAPPNPGKAKACRKSKSKKHKKGTKDTKPSTATKTDAQLKCASDEKKAQAEKCKKSGDEKVPFKVTVSPKFFDPDREMTKMFGRGTVTEATPEVLSKSAAMSAAAHKRDKYKRGPKTIVMRRAYWPPLNADPAHVEMEQTAPGVFRYVHPRKYDIVQREFDAVVQTCDPEGLMYLLQEHPWHVDTLLQLSTLHAQLNEEESAEDMVCRCIYALQSAFHHAFTLTGSSTLPYSIPENRPLFTGLFRYAGFLGKRGCSRTALEIVKLLLSIDKTDPLGAVFLLDYYAIRGGELSTVFALGCDPLYGTFPNVLFSVSLARHIRQDPEADFALDRAIGLYPLIVPVLLKRQELEHDHSDILSMKTYDVSALTKDSPSIVIRAIEIFCIRNCELWKDPSVVTWLTTRAGIVARRLEQAEENEDEWALGVLFERKQIYLHANTNFPEAYGHLIPSDFTDDVARIPRDAIAPPRDEQHQNVVTHAPTNSILGLFLYTLLPWAQVPNAPPEGPGGERPNDGDNDGIDQ